VYSLGVIFAHGLWPMTANTLAIPATLLQAERLPGEMPLYRVDLGGAAVFGDGLLPEFGFAAGLGEGAQALTLVAESPVLAQQFDQDILGDLVTAWTIFWKSGQIWALLIGIVVGYFIRNLTAY